MRNPYSLLPTVTYRIESADTIQADTAFKVVLAPINEPSDDGRVIVDTLGWREPPLPFMASDSEMGHGDAVRVGNLTDFEVDSSGDTTVVSAIVTFDSDSERGDEFARLAAEGSFNGVSIHMGKADFFPVVFRDGEWQKITFDEIMDAIDEAETEDEVDEFLATILLGAFDAEIAAATQVAIPAFPAARIDENSAVDEPVAATAGTIVSNIITQAQANTAWLFEPGDPPLIAAASLDRPPADWFENPNLTEPTPLTVTDDGQVYGHLATWDTCHAGFQGQCVRAPRDADYTAFLTARVVLDNGERQPVGPLVVDDGHAPVDWSIPKVVQYYADTKLAAAYVNVGEDDIGVWVAGAVSHKASKTQIETLRRHPLSGDWRSSDGGYRLIAAVSINAPGLPIPEVLVADGQPAGLITYGPYEPEASDLALVAAALERVSAHVARVDQRLDEIAERPGVEAEAEALLADLA